MVVSNRVSRGKREENLLRFFFFKSRELHVRLSHKLERKKKRRELHPLLPLSISLSRACTRFRLCLPSGEIVETEMQRHAESGPPAGPPTGRNGIRNVRTADNGDDHGTDAAAAANAVAAVARTPTAAASTPRGAADDASDAGTHRDGASQLRKRGRSCRAWK